MISRYELHVFSLTTTGAKQSNAHQRSGTGRDAFSPGELPHLFQTRNSQVKSSQAREITTMKKQIPINKSAEEMMRIVRHPLKSIVTVVTTTLILSAAADWAAPQATWSSTGSMSVGRFVFTATTLQNSRVLVAGGVTPGDE